ncbi:MAG: alpha/beta hydrolase [Bdellovibrio sp.]|nr:alpha/beta hydrolase [Bdellovibrio sp.]
MSLRYAKSNNSLLRFVIKFSLAEMKNPDREYCFGKPSQKLFLQEWGSASKPTILLVHGFPGCAEHGKLLTSTVHLSDFRLISFDRPGYGRSDYQKNLTPLKLASQIKQLLDYLKIDKIKVLSVSGGAPYAMAIAFLLKERVEKISSVAGVAPLTIRNFKFMNASQKKAWMLRNFVPSPILNYGLNRMWKSGLNKIDDFLFSGLENFSLADQIVFKHPDVGPALISSIKTSLQAGPAGVLHDMKVYSKSWGFSLKGIKCPVTLWHGSADDVVHVRFTQDMNRRIPQSKVNMVPAEGHYSLPMNFRDAIISDLLV